MNINLQSLTLVNSKQISIMLNEPDVSLVTASSLLFLLLNLMQSMLISSINFRRTESNVPNNIIIIISITLRSTLVSVQRRRKVFETSFSIYTFSLLFQASANVSICISSWISFFVQCSSTRFTSNIVNECSFIINDKFKQQSKFTKTNGNIASVSFRWTKSFRRY